MDIRELTKDYAVSPQIEPQDLAALRDAGFACVVNNRPDAEVTPDLQGAALRAAAEAAGLAWVDNPVSPSGLTPENVLAQRRAIEEADGRVFAYCRSGTRSTIVWAFAMAGRIGTDEIVAAGARGGYDLEPYRGQITALAGPV